VTTLDDRPAPTAPPTALRRTDDAVARFGEAARTWLEAMWRADPLADAVVADGRASTRAVRTLMTDGLGAVEARGWTCRRRWRR
jgi:hypothetical protein